jgi:hypothetical protein
MFIYVKLGERAMLHFVYAIGGPLSKELALQCFSSAFSQTSYSQKSFQSFRHRFPFTMHSMLRSLNPIPALELHDFACAVKHFCGKDPEL